MRNSGILLPISSLNSPYGIGTMGKAAFTFVDALKKAGIGYWQLLPVGPISYGDSPYQSFSSYAGNPYLIDLELLAQDGLLEQGEYASIDWGSDPKKVDYGKLYENRFLVLEKVFLRGETDPAFPRFCETEAPWLWDYAFFMALKEHFGMKAWTQWEDDAIRRRERQAMDFYKEKLSRRILFWEFLQYLFYKQYDALKSYAVKQGVGIIGDIPIYAALDSADVWAEPHVFQLSDSGFPTHVAGCPPDNFFLDGQLWGNPLYDWDYLQKTGYDWWIRRVKAQTKLFDIIRIDHFRGLESYYAIEADAKTAQNGRWCKGPGMELFLAIRKSLGAVRFIAEDLGFLTQEVKKLVQDSGYPGMKILQFAFDSREESDYLPHNYEHNCVVYTGTHDNDTVIGWYQSASQKDKQFCTEYLNANGEKDVCWQMIRAAWASVADLAVVPMQDVLQLGREGRMNVPSTLGGNWQWRMEEGAFTEEKIAQLHNLGRLYGRIHRPF